MKFSKELVKLERGLTVRKLWSIYIKDKKGLTFEQFIRKELTIMHGHFKKFNEQKGK